MQDSMSMSTGYCDVDNYVILDVNGEKFTFLHKDVTSTEGSISLSFPNWHVIVLSNLQSKQDITISCKSMIILGTLKSTTGGVTIDVLNGRFDALGAKFESKKDNKITSKDQCFHAVSKTRKEEILKIFKSAIDKPDSDGLLDGLHQTVDFIKDPLCKNEDCIPVVEMMEFFGIPEKV